MAKYRLSFDPNRKLVSWRICQEVEIILVNCKLCKMQPCQTRQSCYQDYTSYLWVQVSHIPLFFGQNGWFQKIFIPYHRRHENFNLPLPSEIPKSLTPTTPLLLYPDNSNFKHYLFSDFVSRDIFSKYLISQHFFPEISSILLLFTYDCKYPVPPKTPDRTSWSQLTWNLHCIKRFIDSSEFADVWYRTNVVWCCVTFRDKTSPSYLSAHIKSIRTILDNLEMKTARYIFVTGDCRAFPPTTGGSNYIGAEYKCYIKWIITKKGRYTD